MVAQQISVAIPASPSEDRALVLELLASGMALPEFLEALESIPGLRGRGATLSRRAAGEPAPRATLQANPRGPMPSRMAAPPSADPAHWYRATAPLWDAIDRAWPADAEQAA